MKKYLVQIKTRRDIPFSDDRVLIVKTNDIEKFMDNFCSNMLDVIDGYEYDQIGRIKRNDAFLLCSNWVGADIIEERLGK